MQSFDKQFNSSTGLRNKEWQTGKVILMFIHDISYNLTAPEYKLYSVVCVVRYETGAAGINVG